jgi:hypothetical protein
MDEQTRLTYLTRHYYELQGIRTAPFWLTMLAYQTESLGVAQFPRFYGVFNGHVLNFFATISWVCLMGYFSWRAGQYYRRHFGSLESNWITLPTNRIYWSLLLCCVALSIYNLVFLGFRGMLPYCVTLVWISPLFEAENPPLRRFYFALAGALVVFSTLFIQLTHRNNAVILVIQCIVLLALGIADHMLLMSLCTPPREDVDA